ncbi:hypothetical protein, partial [Photorhabdus sp. RM157S]|uniref:hypothetical protein n=1 Tax=Photorhabdus sp. RM157S TaxID=3342827 RepID=UPI0036D7B971
KYSHGYPCHSADRKTHKAIGTGSQRITAPTRKSRKKRKDASQLRINPTEPDAVVQKLKRGRGFSTSYKPSV